MNEKLIIDEAQHKTPFINTKKILYSQEKSIGSAPTMVNPST